VGIVRGFEPGLCSSRFSSNSDASRSTERNSIANDRTKFTDQNTGSALTLNFPLSKSNHKIYLRKEKKYICKFFVPVTACYEHPRTYIQLGDLHAVTILFGSDN
jgi:hypothetical protein